MQTLKFNYYDEFACTGPECEDSCCKHWNIYLTKREYLNYKKLDCSPELRLLLDTAFKRTKSDNDLQYAKMELKEDGSCPFLGEDRLCMLQKEKGESALSTVCMTYPRNWVQVGKDAAVYTLNPTCYHVVELLMNHPDGLTLSEGEYEQENRWTTGSYWIDDILEENDPTLPYIWSIKTAQLDILQNREFTIAERLLILGYYTQKICGYLESSPEKIAPLGTMMLDNEFCRKIADSLKTHQTEQQAITKSLVILFKITAYLNINEPTRYVTRLVNTVAKNVGLEYKPADGGGYTTSVNGDVCAKNRGIYKKIEKERPYIIENLLAALAFSVFSKDGGELWSDYFSLSVLYNFIQYYLAAFLPESFTDKELALAIAGTVKMLTGTNIVKEVVMRDFAESGMNSLSHVAFLIN